MKKTFILILLFSSFLGYTSAQNFDWAFSAGSLPASDGQDDFTFMREDESGNKYFLAETVSASFGIKGEKVGHKGHYLFKVDNSGALAWSKKLAKPVVGGIWIDQMMLDEDYVYLAGRFKRSVEFNQNGSTSVKVDSEESLDGYVVRYNISDGELDHLQVIKTIENTPGGFNTRALAIDDSYVYVGGEFKVTGRSIDFDNDGDADYTLATESEAWMVKYDKATMGLSWFTTFGQQTGDGTVSVRDILPFGDELFITGLFAGTTDLDPDGASPFEVTSQGDIDGFLATYNNNDATLIWAEQLSSAQNVIPKFLAYDNGNLYLAGLIKGETTFNYLNQDPALTTSRVIAGDDDVFLVKYQANEGNPVWQKSFGSTQKEGLKDMKVNAEGAFLAGFFAEAINFDGDAANNVTPKGGKDLYLSKYDKNNGDFLWVNALGGINSEEDISITALNENITVAGEFSGTVNFNPAGQSNELSTGSSAKDFFYVSYNNDNALIEGDVEQYGGEDRDYGGYARVRNSFIGDDGTAYSLGYISGKALVEGIEYDGEYITWYVAKHSPSGVTEWFRLFLSGHDYDLDLNDILIDETGVYIYGESDSDLTVDFNPNGSPYELDLNSKAFLAKYSHETMELIWVNALVGDGNSSAHELAQSGNHLVISGEISGGTIDFDPSGNTAISSDAGLFLAQYTVDGHYSWHNILSTSEDIYYSNFLINENDILISGGFEGTINLDTQNTPNELTANDRDAFFAKYNLENGENVWANAIVGDDSQYITSISVISNDRLLVIGRFNSNQANLNAAGSEAIVAKKLQTDDENIFFGFYDTDTGDFTSSKLLSSVTPGGDIYFYEAQSSEKGTYIMAYANDQVNLDPDGDQTGNIDAGESYLLIHYGPDLTYRWHTLFTGFFSEKGMSVEGQDIYISGGVYGKFENNGIFIEPIGNIDAFFGRIINVLDQEIIFNDDFSNVGIGEEVDLNATATSGLPVSYTSSDENVAFIDGGMLKVINFGEVTITTSQAGNEYFRPAEDVSMTLTVSTITGLEGDDKQSITTFPNPARYHIKIRLHDNSRIESVKITSLTGIEQELVTILQENDGLYRLSTEKLPAGLYFLEIQLSKDKKLSTKFIRQN